MRVRELMTSAAAWLAESMPGCAERSSSDESIRRALLAKLRSQSWWDPHRCDVTVRDGIAGVPASARERIATRAAAVSIPGVRGFKDGRSYCVPKGSYS